VAMRKTHVDTATNAALDELRRRRRRPRLVGDEIVSTVVDDSAERAMTAVENSDRVSAALARIPEDFRLALVLRDVADLDYDEIGRILDLPGGTVRSRIARGRARLADLIGNQDTTTERPMDSRPVSGHDRP
ncbi:MAG: sigma-70 family RNA polymerase sigma factor, partial [Actinomycetota bacterium]